MTASDKPEGYVFGRPTEYRDHYCEDVIEWARQGMSLTEMAAEIGVTRHTMNNWKDVHPDFFTAITLAQTICQGWWEKQGRINLAADKFNSNLWSRNMSCRFKDEWREKVAHVGGNEDDSPIKQEVQFGADAFTRAVTGLVARRGESGTDVPSD